MLTVKQREALDFVVAYSGQHGVAPSYREIADALTLRSKSGVNRLVVALVDRGFLRMRSSQARSLEVVRNTIPGFQEQLQRHIREFGAKSVLITVASELDKIINENPKQPTDTLASINANLIRQALERMA